MQPCKDEQTTYCLPRKCQGGLVKLRVQALDLSNTFPVAEQGSVTHLEAFQLVLLSTMGRRSLAACSVLLLSG